MLVKYAIRKDKYPLIIVGIRGYYRDTMGVVGKNDRNLYDDAIFLVSDNVTASFNGNTDPSAYQKGIANLVPNAYYAHNFGKHKGQYLALVQRKGEVVVVRDGEPPKVDKGYFGINIHKGGRNTTSSLGCQTIHPDQWDGFIQLAAAEAKRLHGKDWDKVTIPYVLIDNNN